MPNERLYSDTYIELGPDDLKLLKKLKVGGRVRIVLYGTLKAMTERAEDASSETSEGGSLTVTVKKMNLASNNDVAELLDDEDDV